MKKILEGIIRRRNPQFRFDPAVSNHVLFHFAWQQILAILRGSRLWLAGRHPQGMLRGRSVQFFNLPHIRWGRFLKLGDYVTISGLGRGHVVLGHHVSIGAFSRVIISTSLNHLGESIEIGDNVGIGEYAYLGGGGGLRIGHDCIIGQYLSCHPENHVHSLLDTPIRHQGVTRKGIDIGPNCWIGSKVTILDGVHIGEGCVIAAGSVVTKSFPPRTVIGGVPARVLRMREAAATV